MSARLIDPSFRAVDSNGVPINGAKLNVYEAGTSTPINTYSDSGLTTPNTNPVLSSAVGIFGDMFVAADDYKVVYTDASDNVIDTWDNLAITSTPTFSLTSTVNAQTGTSYTLQTTDRAKLVTFTNANAIALAIPQAGTSSFPDGYYSDLSNTGAGTTTITPNTSTIDGLATYELTSGQSVRVVSDGSNYQIVAATGKESGVNAQTGTSYTITTGDREKLVTFSNSATVAISLAQANTTTFKDGWWVEVENTGAGLSTVTPATSTIGGLATLVLTRGQRAKIISDGTNYQAVLLGDAVGDVKFGYGSTAPQGWLVEDGSTIGSTASSADNAGPIFEALYHKYWNDISDTYAAVSTGRGGSAAADFAADKTLTIPDNDKRVPYGAGTETTGETIGAATVSATGTVGVSGATTLTAAQVPALTYTVNMFGSSSAGEGAINNSQSAGTVNDTTTGAVTTNAGGGSHTHSGGTFTGSGSSVEQLGRVIYWYIKY